MNQRTLFFSYCMSFITIGMIANTAGPLIPIIEATINISSFQSGSLISASSIGMIFTVIFGGYLSDIISKKVFLLFGSFFLIIGSLVALALNGFYPLFISLVILGVGFAIFTIGVNSYVITYCETYKKSEEKTLNLVHFCFGLGAIIGPLTIQFGVKSLNFWKINFIIFLLFALIIAILNSLVKTLQVVHPAGHNTRAELNKIFSNSFLWIISIITLLYVGIEISTYGWLPSFWAKSIKNSSIPASYSASIFWIALTGGRLFCGNLTKKIGYLRYLQLSALLLTAITIAWSFTNSQAITITLIILAGLSLSGIFPTLINIAVNENRQLSGTITSLITIFASIGGLCIPMLIGKIVDIRGMEILPITIFICAIIFVLLTFTGKYLYNKRKLTSPILDS